MRFCLSYILNREKNKIEFSGSTKNTDKDTVTLGFYGSMIIRINEISEPWPF